LIRTLKGAGFEGPHAGGKHEFMVKGNLRLTLPNPHQGEISKDLLSRILKQAGISRGDWEKL
jgi:predicted RNA binding protein YcfA (HicA-like mRNA interferase family)